MIENIRNEFRSMLFENDWMDFLSKKAAVEKVLKLKNYNKNNLNKFFIIFNLKADLIATKIGYPDYTFIDFHLNYLYKDVRLHIYFY